MRETRSSRQRFAKRAPRVLAVLVAPCLLLAGGCDRGGGEQLTKAQVIKTSDALCRNARERTEALTPPRSLRAAAPYLRGLTAIAKNQYTRTRSLETPGRDRETFDAWTSELQEFVDLTNLMADAAADGDQAEFQELATLRNASLKRSNRAAQAYGMTLCGAGDIANRRVDV